jgi:Ca2+-binding EF-hand superfamily protein
MTIGDLETQLEEDDDVDTESRLLEMFKCFDVDQSGTIDCNEMHQLLLYMGVSATAEDVKKLIQQVDSDEDGQIVQAEFMQVMKLAQAGELSIAAPTRQSIRRASIRITRDRPMLSL